MILQFICCCLVIFHRDCSFYCCIYISQQTLSIDFQFQLTTDAYAITSEANLENSVVGKGIEILYFFKAENALQARRIHLFIVRMLPLFTQQEYILKIFTVLMCYDENKSCKKIIPNSFSNEISLPLVSLKL